MAYFITRTVFSCFAPLFACCGQLSGSVLTVEKEIVVDESPVAKVVVPERPLAYGSLKIIPISTNPQEFSSDSYKLIRKIIKVWKDQGISDYLIYAKMVQGEPRSWEIVPYPKGSWGWWRQLKVLWNITFGSGRLSEDERDQVANRFKNHSPETLMTSLPIESESSNDAFCNPEVIKKQSVWEGKTVRILYNYAPLGLDNEKLHFLITPKAHRENFASLTEEEYAETMELSQKLIQVYQKDGTAYLYDKTGAKAGQTVPHWHRHIVFTANKMQDFLGKLNVAKNMLFGSSALPPKELEERVKKHSNILSTQL